MKVLVLFSILICLLYIKQLSTKKRQEMAAKVKKAIRDANMNNLRQNPKRNKNTDHIEDIQYVDIPNSRHIPWKQLDKVDF